MTADRRLYLGAPGPETTRPHRAAMPDRHRRSARQLGRRQPSRTGPHPIK